MISFESGLVMSESHITKEKMENETNRIEIVVAKHERCRARAYQLSVYISLTAEGHQGPVAFLLIYYLQAFCCSSKS